jgi:cation diffusion facilitator family transporter
MQSSYQNRSNLTRYAWLSVAVALLTIGLKTVAYFLTGSVGLLSDALESIVNLVGAMMALAMLTIAAKPADKNHTYGHSKAEYFSSGVEGTLILVAAISIAYTAVERLIHPQPLEQIGIGLIVSVLASVANLGVALILIRAGKEHNSVSLTSNGKHLMTDVWTSVGVLIGVGAVALTGWQPLDSFVAIAVAINIVFTGFKIVRGSVSGLMDVALDSEDQKTIMDVLSQYDKSQTKFHALRTRQAGAMKFVSMHVLVPPEWTVDQGHKLVNTIEEEIHTKIPGSIVLTHLEPLNDPTTNDEMVFYQ